MAFRFSINSYKNPVKPFSSDHLIQSGGLRITLRICGLRSLTQAVPLQSWCWWDHCRLISGCICNCCPVRVVLLLRSANPQHVQPPGMCQPWSQKEQGAPVVWFVKFAIHFKYSCHIKSNVKVPVFKLSKLRPRVTTTLRNEVPY